MRRPTRCSSSTSPLAEERLRDLVPPGRDRLQLRRRLLERDVDDLVAVERGHAPERALVREVGGLQPIAGREDPVARRRRTAALDMAEHGHSRLEAGPLLDLPPERVADAAELRVAELVGLTRLAGNDLLLARL